MKNNILLILMALASLSANAGISLNGDWHFCYAKDKEMADSLVAQGFYNPDFDLSAFDVIPVPSCWPVLGYEEPVYRGFKDDKASEGLYVKKFIAPKSFGGKDSSIDFGGVWNSAEVWLNGHWLGRHDSGYTSFSMNTAGYLKPDTVNVLAVRVRQVYPGYKTDTYDDWTLGGIYRDVTLDGVPKKQWIDRVTATTKFDKDYKDAELQLRIMVGNRMKNTLPGNYQSPGKPYDLQIELEDKNGNIVAAADKTIGGHIAGNKETVVTLHIPDALKWTAETPNLYNLSITMFIEGKERHWYKQKIGLREISTEGGVFRINGKPVTLRGVNHHDEHPDVGRAVTRKHWIEDLKLMKENNINYVRAAHYQHAKGFIELCDSMGMYVGAEVSLGGAGNLMYQSSFVPSVMTRVFETVLRDLNNPSIIYWSVGNEDPFTSMHLDAVKTVKALDPTRPCLLPWNAAEHLPDEIDILAPHYWTSYEYDSIASNSKRPIITTEYVHAYGTQRFGGLEDCFKAITRHPAGAGGAVWMWADQGIKTPTIRNEKLYGGIVKNDRYLRVSSAGWDGITDSYRNPTRDLLEVKAVYCPVYPSADTVAVNKKDHFCDIPLYNGYDFTSLDKIRISYALYADNKLLKQDNANVSASPHSTGILRVDMNGIPDIMSDETVYVVLDFSDENGKNIGRKYVDVALEKNKRKHQKNKLEIIDNGSLKTISVGNTSYCFDSATGHLDNISKNGETVIGKMQPTIWHALNEGDLIIKNRSFAKGVSPATPKHSVKSFDCFESGGKVFIKSDVEYTIDSNNSFEALFSYCINNDGSLDVEYSILPEVALSYLPVVGVKVSVNSPADIDSWLGLGPDEAFPNKKAGVALGVWDAKEFTGTRSARWLSVKPENKQSLRIYTNNGYIDRDKKSDSNVRILSHVLGRPEKGRLNDRNYQLPSGKRYHGSFRIE